MLVLYGSRCVNFSIVASTGIAGKMAFAKQDSCGQFCRGIPGGMRKIPPARGIPPTGKDHEKSKGRKLEK
jgi:hypothetical protein